MKKIYFIAALFLFCVTTGKSQCAIDSTNVTAGFWPPAASLSAISQGLAYDTSIQFYLPAFVNDTTDTLQIGGVIFDSIAITGLPPGITYALNPASPTSISPNGWFCVNFSGTTAAPFGVYNLSFSGSVQVSPAQNGHTLLTIPQFNQALDTGYGITPLFQYYLVVQAPPLPPCNNIDTTHLTGPGVYPVASDLPCIVQGTPYDQTVQGRIEADSIVSLLGLVSATVTVDSMELDSIAGLPTGITFGRSPVVLYGGGSGCVNFAGTSTDTVGTYPLTAYGIVWFTINAAGMNVPYTRQGNLNPTSPFGGYYLRVVTISDSCTLTIPTPPSGINEYFKSLNAKISVYPNPNNGVFELNINAASPVNGQILVYDAIGRELYQQPVDVHGFYSTTLDLSKFGSGLYFVQVQTPQGSAVKKISVQ